MKYVLTLVCLFSAGLLVEAKAPPAPFRLVSNTKHQQLAVKLPTVDDERIDAVLRDPRLILFTEEEVPPAFQAANNGVLGVFRMGTSFNVGGVNVGHGSSQFPWKAPAGLDDATGWTSFRFLHLPPGQQVVWRQRRLPNDVQSARSIQWTFPVGTITGEVFQLTGDPTQPTFEMRVRRKVGDTSWLPSIFRPFRTRDELNLAVAFSGDPNADRFVGHDEREEWKLNNRIVSRGEAGGTAVKDFLPPLGAQTLRHLLDRPFASVRDHQWVDGGHAPDVRSGFHIVPPSYNGAMLPVSQNVCAGCHRTAGQNVRQFRLNSPAGWDEWVRGNAGDESFTWHPFAKESVSTGRNFLEVRIDHRLIDAGLIRKE